MPAIRPGSRTPTSVSGSERRQRSGRDFLKAAIGRIGAKPVPLRRRERRGTGSCVFEHSLDSRRRRLARQQFGDGALSAVVRYQYGSPCCRSSAPAESHRRCDPSAPRARACPAGCRDTWRRPLVRVLGVHRRLSARTLLSRTSQRGEVTRSVARRRIAAFPGERSFAQGRDRNGPFTESLLSSVPL